MTESSLLTRCPNCQTRFRVTQEQLGIAAGKVRCGNCMEVFNALEHRSRPEAPAAAANTDQPPASQPPSATGSAADSTAPGDDELLFADNPDEDATEGRYAGTRSSFSDDELSDSFLAIDQHAGSGFIADDEVDTTASIDESWAEAMLSDDDEPATAEPPSPAPEQPAPARRFRRRRAFRTGMARRKNGFHRLIHPVLLHCVIDRFMIAGEPVHYKFPDV